MTILDSARQRAKLEDKRLDEEIRQLKQMKARRAMHPQNWFPMPPSNRGQKPARHGAAKKSLTMVTNSKSLVMIPTRPRGMMMARVSLGLH